MARPTLSPSSAAAIRQGLAELPRADNLSPGQRIEKENLYTVDAHRAALDPERALVVGNRGMGKSFWAHALAQEETRQYAATAYRRPELLKTNVEIGFNASEGKFAPSPEVIEEQAIIRNPECIWRAVLVRIVAPLAGQSIPERFAELVEWVEADAERTAKLMSKADDALVLSNRRLLVVFDALDRLGDSWKTVQELTRGLLKRSLACQAHRAIRLKLFMRVDQFSDPALFDFPDASKIRNNRVDLYWPDADLYGLLFSRLRRSSGASAFAEVDPGHGLDEAFSTPEQQKIIVDAIAGEFMGSDKKRGRVYTWLPLHLADAFMQTSPRTFLTAWRESALHNPAPKDKAVDHLGIAEGVRKASEDRLRELAEDYWWISTALAPLKGELVPMPLQTLTEKWRRQQTAKAIIDESTRRAKLAPVQLATGRQDPEHALVTALKDIGVLEIRANQKINVPDIFRIEAGIKRLGGVKPPRRGTGV